MMREPSISFLSVLILIGSAQGLFLALALVFLRRGNRRANLFLAALLLTLSVLLVDGFLIATNYYSRYPRLIALIWPWNFLVGPFLYFYVRELSSPKRMVFSWGLLLHFLPAIAFALFPALFYSMSAYENVSGWAYSLSPLKGTQLFTQNVVSLLVVLQKAVYYLLSFLLVIAYGSRIKQSFSSLETISLSWLRTLLLLFFSLCILFTFFSFFAAPFGIYREIGYLLYLGTAVVTYVMAFKAILQPEIFSRIEAARQAELIRTDEVMVPDAPALAADMPQETGGMMFREKYQKSWLTDERATEIVRRLLRLMEIEKPHLEPELTLPELAAKLSVSPHHLSQVINRETNKSFFDFVNEYRVQEAKRLLGSPKHGHLSILGIALDAGFNSKSAFYTAFGKHIGMTPSEFKKHRVWAEHGATPDLPRSA
jgi:AraC-like DNA-binding protein